MADDDIRAVAHQVWRAGEPEPTSPPPYTPVSVAELLDLSAPWRCTRCGAAGAEHWQAAATASAIRHLRDAHQEDWTWTL